MDEWMDEWINEWVKERKRHYQKQLFFYVKFIRYMFLNLNFIWFGGKSLAGWISKKGQKGSIVADFSTRNCRVWKLKEYIYMRVQFTTYIQRACVNTKKNAKEKTKE